MYATLRSNVVLRSFNRGVGSGGVRYTWCSAQPSLHLSTPRSTPVYYNGPGGTATGPEASWAASPWSWGSAGWSTSNAAGRCTACRPPDSPCPGPVRPPPSRAFRNFLKFFIEKLSKKNLLRFLKFGPCGGAGRGSSVPSVDGPGGRRAVTRVTPTFSRPRALSLRSPATPRPAGPPRRHDRPPGA